MANILQDGAAWLGGKLTAHAGHSVSLEQGSATLTGLTASVAMHDYEVIDSSGMLTAVLSYDWTFVAADLVAAGGSGFELRKGAVVIETVSGVTRRYEAMPLGSKPAAERLDPSGILLTLHTKKVG